MTRDHFDIRLVVLVPEGGRGAVMQQKYTNRHTSKKKKKKVEKGAIAKVEFVVAGSQQPDEVKYFGFGVQQWRK